MFHAGACCEFRTVFPPIDIQQALIQHTQCPCRFVILATKALQSQASRQTYIYIASATRYQVHTRYTHGVASGLFSWSMAARLLAFSSRQFALTINHGPLFASHYFSFLSKRSGRRMPPAERSALYIIRTWYRVRIFKLWEIASNEGKMK